MDVRITTRFLVHGDHDLDAETDRLFKAMLAREAKSNLLSEADVSVVLGAGIVDMSIVVRAGSWSEAQAIAKSVFFDAIEEAGGVPGREDDDQAEDPRALIVQGTELVPAR